MRRYPSPSLTVQPLAVGLALLIALFAALAPTLSHALVWVRGGASSIVQVCTETGPRWVALASFTDSSEAPSTPQTLEHCPFCLHLTDRAAPPPPSFSWALTSLGRFVQPHVRLTTPFFSVFYLAPPPRGPPAFV